MKTGFKAFKKGLVCRGFQYKVGETYTHKGKAHRVRKKKCKKVLTSAFFCGILLV